MASDPFVGLSPGEKKGWSPTNYFLYVFGSVFDHDWYEFQLRYCCLCFFPEKLKCQILLQGISDATNIVIYHAVTTEKSKKKSSLIQFHILFCSWNSFRHFKMIKRNKFLWKKEWSYKNMKLGRKSSWIFWVEEKLILYISGSTGISFLLQEVGRKIIFP